MKRFSLSILTILAISLALTSCSKENPTPEPIPSSDDLNYLVMYYAVGGGDLDGGQMANILQALAYGSSEKVKMTFEYKLSGNSSEAKFQTDERFSNFNGTRRFTSDQNIHFIGQYKREDLSSELNVNDIENLCNNLKSDRIGDAQYLMATDTALASFINWSRSMYPKAKNLMLILGNHGGGWNLKSDGKIDCTKSIESDDNIKNGPTITAKAVERAIASSDAKRLKMIYTDACLMSVHENYATYEKVADYALSAVEYTPGCGGDYYDMLEKLNSAGADDASLWNFSKSYIDYLNNDWWKGLGYCDLGVFDLRKNGALTAVCKSITDSLVNCWNNTAPITPGSSYTLWKEYIRVAVTKCEVCVSGNLVEEIYVPAAVKPFLAEANIRPDKNGDYVVNAILAWLLGNSESFKKACDQVPEDVIDLRELIECVSHEEYCLSDLLRVLNKNLKTGGLDDAKNPFINLRAKYISALKAMSYINCTNKTSEPDYAYDHCSPGIFIYTFNPSTWGTGHIAWFKYNGVKLSDAIKYYGDSDFHKATCWGDFLQLIDVFPSLVTNSTRSKYKPE